MMRLERPLLVWAAISFLVSAYVAYVFSFCLPPALVFPASILACAAARLAWREIELRAMLRAAIPDLGVLLLAITAYSLLIARKFVSGRLVFDGDNAGIFSADYLLYYSVKHFNEYPWWNPTDANGVPFYYILGSYLQAPLSPLKLPALGFFRILCDFVDIDVNGYICFVKTVYTFTLNVVLFHVVGRLLTREVLAASAGTLLFSFCYVQTLALTDHVVAENLSAPLLLLGALTHCLRRGTEASFWLLLGAAAIFVAGFTGSFMHSVMFWFPPLMLALVALHWSRTRRAALGIVNLARTRGGAIALGIGGCLMLAAIAVVVLPIHYHLGDLLRYRPGIVSVASSSMFSSQEISIEKSPIWSVLFHWIPFGDVHASAKFTWWVFDYRYIGVLTLPLILVAIVLNAQARIVGSLLGAFVLSNMFLISSTENVAYQLLLENVELFRNLRNMSTIMPLGGGALLLILVAAIGADAIHNRPLRLRGVQGIVAMAGLLAIALLGAALAVAALYLPHTRTSLAHVGVYLSLFGVLAAAALSSRRRVVRGGLLLLMMVIAAMEMIVPLGPRIVHGNEKTKGSPLVTSFSLINQDGDNENRFFGNYRGYFYGGYPKGEPFMAPKAWLAIYSRPEWRPLLENWDVSSGRVRKFPSLDFRSATDMRALRFLDEPSSAAAIGFVPGRTLVLEQGTVDLPPVQELASIPSSAMIEVVHASPSSVLANVRSPAPGYLYFADNFDRFWNVAVNGVPAPVLRANFAFKAVYVGAGEHVIRWEYRPRPFQLAYGLFYMLLGAFALAAVLRWGASLRKPEGDHARQG